MKCFSKDTQEGTIFYPGVVIMNDCRIGKFTLLNSGVTLGHDVGIGASIKEKITIGENAVIGAGSVVINDVLDNTTVYGVPAKTAT